MQGKPELECVWGVEWDGGRGLAILNILSSSFCKIFKWIAFGHSEKASRVKKYI